MIDYDASFNRPPAIVSLQTPDSYTASFRQARRAPLSILSQTWHEIVVGEAVYHLRAPITLSFYPFILEGYGDLVAELSATDAATWCPIGLGRTLEEASEDWKDKLHNIIQELLCKRQWELSLEDADNMAAIERTIDMPAYYRETPFVVRQIGIVEHFRSMPNRIQWEDGTVDCVRLDQMPPEFAAFKLGQRFEAVCSRDAISCKLRRVVYVARMGRLGVESSSRWDSTPTSRESPEVGWGEID